MASRLWYIKQWWKEYMLFSCLTDWKTIKYLLGFINEKQFMEGNNG